MLRRAGGGPPSGDQAGDRIAVRAPFGDHRVEVPVQRHVVRRGRLLTSRRGRRPGPRTARGSSRSAIAIPGCRRGPAVPGDDPEDEAVAPAGGRRVDLPDRSVDPRSSTAGVQRVEAAFAAGSRAPRGCGVRDIFQPNIPRRARQVASFSPALQDGTAPGGEELAVAGEPPPPEAAERSTTGSTGVIARVLRAFRRAARAPVRSSAPRPGAAPARRPAGPRLPGRSSRCPCPAVTRREGPLTEASGLAAERGGSPRPYRCPRTDERDPTGPAPSDDPPTTHAAPRPRTRSRGRRIATIVSLSLLLPLVSTTGAVVALYATTAARRPSAPADDRPPRSRRTGGREAPRGDRSHLDPAVADADIAAARGGRGRGRRLLPPRRPGHDGGRARRVERRHERFAPAGRLDDHAAVREERVHGVRALDRRKVREAILALKLERTMSKDRSSPATSTRCTSATGRTGAGRGASVLPSRRRGPDAAAVGDARRIDRGALGARPVPPPAAARWHRNAALDRLVEVGWLDPARAEKPGDRSTRGGAARPDAPYFMEHVAATSGPLRPGRPLPAASGSGRRSIATCRRGRARGPYAPPRADRSGGRPGRDRSADRRDPGDGRGPELREERVQPRDGAAAGGERVQAVRVPRGARAGHLPLETRAGPSR